MSISNSAPNGIVTLEMVKDSMFNEEARRKEHGTFTQSEALVTEKRGRSQSRRPNNRDKSRNNLRGRLKSRKEIECYHCHKKGQIKRECRKLQRELRNKKGDRKKDETETAAVASDEGDVIIVSDDSFVGLTGYDHSS